MNLTFTAGTWWQIASNLNSGRVRFSTGFQQRTAPDVAAWLASEVENYPLHGEVSIDFGENYDAYLSVLQAIRAS